MWGGWDFSLGLSLLFPKGVQRSKKKGHNKNQWGQRFWALGGAPPFPPPPVPPPDNPPPPQKRQDPSHSHSQAFQKIKFSGASSANFMKNMHFGPLFAIFINKSIFAPSALFIHIKEVILRRIRLCYIGRVAPIFFSPHNGPVWSNLLCRMRVPEL